jgi:hypothetical protein
MPEPLKPRRFSRVPVPSAAKVRISAPGISLTGLLLDTSEGGLAITVLGEPLKIGQIVTVELLESTADKLPPMRATIRYSIGARHGLEFLPE